MKEMSVIIMCLQLLSFGVQAGNPSADTLAQRAAAKAKREAAANARHERVLAKRGGSSGAPGNTPQDPVDITNAYLVNMLPLGMPNASAQLEYSNSKASIKISKMPSTETPFISGQRELFSTASSWGYDQCHQLIAQNSQNRRGSYYTPISDLRGQTYSKCIDSDFFGLNAGHGCISDGSTIDLAQLDSELHEIGGKFFNKKINGIKQNIGVMRNYGFNGWNHTCVEVITAPNINLYNTSGVGATITVFSHFQITKKVTSYVVVGGKNPANSTNGADFKYTKALGTLETYVYIPQTEGTGLAERNYWDGPLVGGRLDLPTSSPLSDSVDFIGVVALSEGESINDVIGKSYWELDLNRKNAGPTLVYMGTLNYPAE